MKLPVPLDPRPCAGDFLLCGIEKRLAQRRAITEHAFADWRRSMTRKALKARIEEGLFPGEVLVRIRDAQDRDISFFAPIGAVSGREAVTVRLVASNDGQCFIELPGEVYGAGRVVAVREADLTAA
jgi:hypothetical protein